MTTNVSIAGRERDLNSLYMVTVLVVLAIVTMTFGALVFAFVLRSQTSLNWNHITLPPLLWITTGVLLASSVTSELGRRKISRNDQIGFHRLNRWTTGLGTLFLLGQLAVWVQIFHGGTLLDHNPHPSFFFIFSGLHGAHIIVGLTGLFYLLRRTREPASGPRYQMNTRVVGNAVTIFWHYLDLVWIALFILLETWRR